MNKSLTFKTATTLTEVGLVLPTTQTDSLISKIKIAYRFMTKSIFCQPTNIKIYSFR